MGRRAAKKAKGYRSPPSDLLKPEDPASTNSVSKDFDLLPDLSVRDDIDDNLVKIYESFFLEFRKRVAERKQAKDPLSVDPPQRSVLDNKVRAHLVTKIHSLARAIGLSDVYDLFEARTLDFVQRLLEGVKEHQEERMRLGLLEDAFDVMENAIEVVEGLIQGSQDGPQLILKLGKNEFFGMLEQDQDLRALLDWANTFEFTRSHPLYEDLRSFYASDCAEEEEEIEYGERLQAQEMMQNMTLEELVLYINAEEGGSRRDKLRTSNASTADCSKSPRTEAEVEADREIEEFRRRLEVASKKHQKMKPHFSEEWLKRLSLCLNTALKSDA